MIKAKPDKTFKFFFNIYMDYIFRSDFHDMEIEKTGKTDKEKAALILGNHFSWWDGFFLYQVNRKFFKKQFYLMMLEEQLAQRPLFRYAGAFSIKKNSKGIFESMSYVKDLLKDKENLVVIFPEGKFSSLYSDRVSFEKGIERMIKGMETLIDIYFSTVFPEYLDQRKPSLNIYLKKLETSSFDVKSLEQAFNDFYISSKIEQAKKVEKYHSQNS